MRTKIALSISFFVVCFSMLACGAGMQPVQTPTSTPTTNIQSVTQIPTGTSNTNIQSITQTQETQKLPQHVVNDIHQIGTNHKSIWLFLIANKGLTQDDAKLLIEYYDKKYSSFDVFNIDLHCDLTYANDKYILDSQVSDAEYYSHVMYSYMRGMDGTTTFNSRFTSPDYYGSACK